tara:strand:+ start:716 stop:1525 length:810 start_codon:yes stop_codon:yes gene_type:complete
MIIWITSYPKSGNTWLRLLISNYLWSGSSNIFDSLENIPKFPQEKYFKGLVSKEILNQDSIEAFKYFVNAQEKINENKSVKILKTHNFAGSIKGHPFTNLANTCGAIYMVRDPRSVVISNAHHNEYDYEKSVERITSKNNVSFNDGFMEARLTWKIHYLSWKKINVPKIIIKYEDLLVEPFPVFLEVLKFINKFIKVEISKSKIEEVISKCSFENASNNEKKFGFIEKLGKENFFRKGLMDEWKKELKTDLVVKIEKEFEQEMRELNYL